MTSLLLSRIQKIRLDRWCNGLIYVLAPMTSSMCKLTHRLTVRGLQLTCRCRDGGGRRKCAPWRDQGSAPRPSRSPCWWSPWPCTGGRAPRGSDWGRLWGADSTPLLAPHDAQSSPPLSSARHRPLRTPPRQSVSANIHNIIVFRFMIGETLCTIHYLLLTLLILLPFLPLKTSLS